MKINSVTYTKSSTKKISYMININRAQKEEFLNTVVASNVDAQSLLNDAISWIRETPNPEDVFPTRELEKWAEGEGYSK